MLMTGVLALLATQVAISQVQVYRRWPAAVLFGLIALWCWVGAIRALRVGVNATQRGIVIRGLWRTGTIPWQEVEGIESGPTLSGPAGISGPTAPIVVRNQPGKGVRHVILKVVGGYALSRVRPTPAEQAVVALSERWVQWRTENRTTGDESRGA
jgi:hypothetical protein